MAEDERSEQKPPESSGAEAEEPGATGEPAGEEAVAEDPGAEEAVAQEPPADEPVEVEAPPEAAATESETEEPSAPAAAGDEVAEAERRERPKPRRRRGGREEGAEEVIPGEHLEPDLVLEEEQPEGELGELGGVEIAAAEEPVAVEEVEAPEEPQREPEPRPVAREPIDLAADARYRATGKRKSAVARVTLKPGSGAYIVNGRALEDALPRPRLQRIARQPLETAGYESRMDVVARIHGGGVSSQAGALRHGIARALVEADPNLRLDLKRRGFLTRDPRVKERKKAGLKKARKRPQFSKR